MNKQELIDDLYERLSDGYTHAPYAKMQLVRILDVLAVAVHEELYDGGEVTLPGLGKLTARRRAERAARNPQTGEALTVPAKTVVKFKAAKALADAVANT